MENGRVLLVEGESDKSFFEEIFKYLELDTSVIVAPPKNVGGTYNIKEGVLNHLSSVMLKQLDDARIERLAIVVDADSGVNRGGYSRTKQRVTEIVEHCGFTLKPESDGGILFQNEDELADFGLWVMPDNLNDGMLEDFIKICVHSNENELFTHAQTSVDTLPKPLKFKEIHTSKAEVATWLAWQKKPGRGLYYAVEDRLIDDECELFRKLRTWLTHIYS